MKAKFIFASLAVALALPSAATGYHYSAVGQRTAQTSPEGHTSRYSYDSLGRLSQVADAQGNTTDYQYNSQGQLLSQTDAEGKVTQYGYDAAGRRVSRTLADGSSEQLTYNALGQLTQKTHLDGSQTTWEYGAAAAATPTGTPNPAWGQITREHRADGSSQTRSYDSHGRHNQTIDSRDGSEQRSLDALGRVSSRNVQHSATQLAGSSTSNVTTHYQWDARGQRTQLRIPASASSPEQRVTSTWDAAGQLSTLQASSDTAAHQFTHDAAGRLTHIQRSDGSSTRYQYNADGHISQIRHQNSQGQALAQFDYQHNRDGQRTQAKETIHSNGQTLQRTIDWTYDPAGKLTREHIQQTQPTAQTLTIAYQYDKVGNRTARTVTGAIQQTTTYQYDANDRLTQSSDSIEGTTSYRYDQRGNLTEKANGNNTTKYSWNSDNRLIKVEHSNNGTVSKTTTYGYDPQGRRIKKLVQQGASKTETHYSLDSERPYHEVAVESTRVNTQPWTHKTYVHTPGGVGELISQSDGATTKQIYADAQGTTRLIADSTTGASQSYSLDAFGNWLAGDGIGASQNPPTHLYTGERYDADTGLIYLRARDYDPATGRFISMDEHPGNQRIPLTLNKYLYANADPVNHIDPSGYITMGGMMSAGINISLAYARMSLSDFIMDRAASSLLDKIVAGYGAGNPIMPGGNPGLNALVQSIGTQCSITKRGCLIGKIPLLSHGSNLKAHAYHIAASQYGYGNTISGTGVTSSILVRGPSPSRPDREFLKKINCKAVGKVCDEYPFASTLNGGEINWNNDTVSTATLPVEEMRVQMRLLSNFYRKSDIVIGRPFFSIANGLVASYYIKNKKMHFLR